MTSSSNAPLRDRPEDTARKAKERLLVFIVVFLGLLIVAGIVAVIMRIIYLSSTAPAQRASPAAAAGADATAAAERLALPPGAAVKSVSVAGDRLAVHYEGPAGSGIAVIDLADGAVLRRFEAVPGAATP